jgi:hypothetical protein
MLDVGRLMTAWERMEAKMGVSATIGFWDAIAVGVRLVIGMVTACVAVLFVFLLALALFC